MNTKTYDAQTAKFAAAVLTSMPEMPSDVMQQWIENPKGLQQALKKALCPPEEKTAPAPNFKTFRTLKLGTGISDGDGFRKALKEAEFSIGDLANDILGKPAFTASPEAKEVELVIVSVAELGFKKAATRKDIYARAIECGLVLCPAEVGPQLRLQYTDQPKGEWLFIGMEPIDVAVLDIRDLRIFDVEHRNNNELWLSSDNGDPGHVWKATDHWVFLRRK
ncbi:MAG: hypothetical protein ACLQU4_07530 [Limisphaerales bacterium]